MASALASAQKALQEVHDESIELGIPSPVRGPRSGLDSSSSQHRHQQQHQQQLQQATAGAAAAEAEEPQPDLARHGAVLRIQKSERGRVGRLKAKAQNGRQKGAKRASRPERLAAVRQRSAPFAACPRCPLLRFVWSYFLL